MTLRVFIASVALSAALAVAAEPFQPGTKGKKLISYGQDWPNPAFCRQHVHEMEQRPFDGIVIVISKERQPQSGGASDGFSAFGKNKLKFDDYAHEIDDLRHTQFKKFTDNFIAVESQPGDVDWFDDAGWQAIAQNFNVLARVAKQGKCVGLEFDPEEYGGHPFTPGAWPEAQRKKHSDAEYVAKAKQRGQQVMRAINADFPRIKFFCLYGPSVTFNDYYHLYTPFLEGMCSAAREGTQIIDGFEQSYGFKTFAEFEQGRNMALLARRHFADKPAFDRVMRFGCGLWMDNQSGKMGWHPTEPEKNYFQPNTWQDAVHLALSWSDEYVWVWHERTNFWTGKDVSEAYLKAQAEARSGPSSK